MHFANWKQAKQVSGRETAEIFHPPLTPLRKRDSVAKSNFLSVQYYHTYGVGGLENAVGSNIPSTNMTNTNDKVNNFMSEMGGKTPLRKRDSVAKSNFLSVYRQEWK